jgi:hypothetical protein
VITIQFSTIYSQVGNLTSSQAVSNDKQFTNEAYADIASRRRWSWLQSTSTIALVAGQTGYTILGTTPQATDFGSPISVTLQLTSAAAGIELGRMDTQTFERFTAHSFTNSQPLFWTIQGGTAASTSATVVSGGQQQIVVKPPPAATAGSGVNLIVRYWRSLSSISMSADSDVPLMPADQHQMIITRACAIAMERNLQFDLAAGFQRSFQEQLAAAIDTDQAMYSGDNNTMILKPVPMEPVQVPVTQATYNPASRPLPAGV